MKKKKNTRSAKSTSKAETAQPVRPVVDIEAIRAQHQARLDACAWAAVYGAGMLENAVQIRSAYVKNLIADAPWICEFASVPLAKRSLLSQEGLVRAEQMFGAAELASTALRKSLSIFHAHIRQLDKAYVKIQEANGISAVKAIRETACQFDRDRHPDEVVLWGHVLKYWEAINPTVVKLVRFMPASNDKDEDETFTFDERGHVWRHEPSGSEIRIQSAFAVAK